MGDKLEALGLDDIKLLIQRTEERAAAAQESASTLNRIYEILQSLESKLDIAVQCTRRVEGLATALAAFLSSNEQAEIQRVQRILNDLIAHQPSTNVRVDQQAGGVRSGDLSSDRDVNIKSSGD